MWALFLALVVAFGFALTYLIYLRPGEDYPYMRQMREDGRWTHPPPGEGGPFPGER